MELSSSTAARGTGAPQDGAILMADDDDDDVFVARRAFSEANIHNPLFRVSDGSELLDFLHRRGGYADEAAQPPRPRLILLDLNMPGIDGREALERIKTDPDLRRIPLVVFTTSKGEVYIAGCYDRGANSYITKPTDMAGMIRAVRTIGTYWLDTVKVAI